jgi:hypothetical protein
LRLQRESALSARAAGTDTGTIALLTDLRPQKLVDSARSTERDTFVRLLLGAPLLLVQLGGRDDALASALAGSAGTTGTLIPPSPDGLPFQTATAQGNVGVDGAAARTRGLKGPAYAVALHKRAGSQTLSDHRICLGRSRTNDVVLRDPSVSKLHAFFQRDEDKNYFLSDVGSHNGSRVNGETISARQAKYVRSGDAVLLGSVATTFLSAADFWVMVADDRA